MSAMTRLTSLQILILMVVAGLWGCQGETPKAAATKPAAAETTEKTPPVVAEVPETPFELEADFQLLSRDDFEAFAAKPETWTAIPEGIASTGRPRGYLYSKQPYDNFTLRLDYRFTQPKGKNQENTGFLVYISGEHKLWPVCIEVQGKFVQMAAIKENGGADPLTVEDDDASRQKARHAVGQWNSLEVVSKAGALTAALNGTPISSSKAGPLTSGLIGIQAEDYPFEVRRMRIRKEE